MTRYDTETNLLKTEPPIQTEEDVIGIAQALKR